MNEKSKKGLFIGIGAVVVVGLAVCFSIALNNTKTGKTKTELTIKSASEVSTEYSTVNYGTSTEVKNEEIVNITEGGSYNLSGSYEQIVINTTKDVELNLSNVEINCTSGPAIYVQNSGVVSIVLTGENKITSLATEDVDGAIYSKDDLVFSGTGSLEITSNYDGIVSKDSLVIKSGTYVINSEDDGIRGKDNVAIVDGTFTINAGGDGIKATNDQDSTLGYITIDNGTFNITSYNDGIQAETNLAIKNGTFTIKTTSTSSDDSAKGIKAGTLIEISGGTFNINSVDDGIHSNGNLIINGGNITITSKDDAVHADGYAEINDGTFTINAAEGIEGTFVKINGGTINISASDDGINAGRKSTDYNVTIEINGGNLTIVMGQGDTDGIDSNGNLYINGGTINITANSPFDYDGEAKYTGGTMIVNGTETTTITNQMMGGGMNGGQPGGMNGGMRGPGMR